MLTIRVTVLALVLAVSACKQPTSVEPMPSEVSPTAALAQCGKDTDCKGDRICDSGACIAPPATAHGVLPPIAQPSSPPPAVKTSGFFTPLRPAGQITLGRCHMGSCSWAKWISVKSLSSSGSQQVLEVTLLGGDSEHEEVEDYPSSPKGVAINWNSEPHTFKVTCSRTAPSVEDDLLSLNQEAGVPGVQESAAELYFVACHSHFDGYPSGIEKFSYNVKEQEF